MAQDLHVLAKSPLAFPRRPEEYAAQPVPSLGEFKQLWTAWDVVTRYMIPENELLSKPIRLRNCCLFYLGHIPTFLDIHLTRATDQKPTEPSFYQKIFERGIDPDVDNPERCHAHSEIPETWPPVGEILDYQARVRSRVEAIFEMGDKAISRKLGRALWLGFEHEGKGYLRGLTFVDAYVDRVLPPPGPVPNFEVLAQKARKYAVHNEWIRVPSSTVSVGMNDPENGLGPARYFGWDNEKPMREITVPGFEAKARPLTNEDFARYLSGTDQHNLPASWISNGSTTGNARAANDRRTNPDGGYLNGHSGPIDAAYLDGKFVRTVYGPVALEHALPWPVFASFDELAGCAKWLGGRVPTADEVRSIYKYVHLVKKKEAEKVQANKISAVNGHLSNDGVEETPPSAPTVNASSGVSLNPNPQDVFVDLEDCNVAFSHFYPTPVTHLGNKLCGQGEMGGVWEWTSTTLEEHDGFEAMGSYPGYTGRFRDPATILLRALRRRDPIETQSAVPTGGRSRGGGEEKNSGLDHKCGICKTVLSSPRAKKTCFGIHEEVCPKYHFTLFYVGNSNKCDACRKSTELHDKRHREIATLILKIQKVDEVDERLSSSATNGKRKTRRSDVFNDYQTRPVLEDISEDNEWADSSTLNENDDFEVNRPGIVAMKENITPGRTSKVERKKARHSSLVQVVTPALMGRIDNVLHPEGRSLEDKSNRPGDSNSMALSHKIIEDNIGFNTNCFRPSSLRQSVHAKKVLKANGIAKTSPKAIQDDTGISLILEDLGVRPHSMNPSKQRSTLVRQLSSAIRDDIEKFENEKRDTMMRMAGYWRYVNRKTYNYMVRNNQIWDWVTGQKLEEIEEETESELDTEEGRDAEKGFWDDTSTVGTPLSGAGTPQKEIEAYSEEFDPENMKTGQLDSDMAALDAKNDRVYEHQEAGGNWPSTPKARQFTTQTDDLKPRMLQPKHQELPEGLTALLTSSEKDDRHHFHHTTIATHKYDGPIIIKHLHSPPSTSQTATNSHNTFLAPRHDPNNRYDPLTNLNGDLNQRLRLLDGAKVLKLAPTKVTPFKETTGAWITVKRKSPGPGKTTYAGALNKQTS
ncbi:MAG: hypothetical protein Q9166_003911 [cf. Caloplaca sp. 2 TL-2023]